MHERDYSDIAMGLGLALFGIFVSWYSAAHYSVGSLRAMGPGMFPLFAGVLLALLGLAIAVQALLREGYPSRFEFRPALAALGAIAAFALALKPFGLIVAIFLLTAIAAIGDSKLGVVAIAILAALVCLAAIVIFRVGLGLPIPLFWGAA